MSNFVTRTITGALFVAVMLLCTWCCFWSFAALFALIIVLCLWEFYSLLEKNNAHPQKYIGVSAGIAMFCWVCYGAYGGGALGAMVSLALTTIIFPLIFFIELFRKKEEPLKNISFTICGIIYIVFPFSLLNTIVFNWHFGDEPQYSPHFLLGFLFLLWSNDTFAYLVGRSIGRTKLFERISPKKTWEGTIGGIVLTQITAYIISIYFKEIHVTEWMLLAAIISVTATLGDLVESMFKRSMNIKDSGGILPGHGGLLDRFDGMLLSAPFVCIYLLLIH